MPLHRHQVQQFKEDPVWQALLLRIENDLKHIELELDQHKGEGLLALGRLLGKRVTLKWLRGLPDYFLANIDNLVENRAKPKEGEGVKHE